MEQTDGFKLENIYQFSKFPVFHLSVKGHPITGKAVHQLSAQSSPHFKHYKMSFAFYY